MNKLLKAAVAVVLPIGLVAVMGSGVAWAKRASPVAVTATGSTTCNFFGRLVINPDNTVSISGNMFRHRGPTCSSQGGSRLRTGHMAATPAVSTDTVTSLCSLVTGGTPPDVSGGAIKWSPAPRVTASTGVSLTGGSVSQVTIGSDTFLRIAYSGESVASGSFANAGGGGLTVTSIYDMAGLSAACAGGPLTAIAFRGSITL